MKEYIVTIGSNIKPHKHVPWALKKLLIQFEVLSVSRFFRTSGVGILSYNIFWNGAVLLRSDLKLSALKIVLNTWEIESGRNRAHPHSAVRDRTLDLDIIWEGEEGWLEDIESLKCSPYIWDPIVSVQKMRSYGRLHHQVWFPFMGQLFGGRRVSTPRLSVLTRVLRGEQSV